MIYQRKVVIQKWSFKLGWNIWKCLFYTSTLNGDFPKREVCQTEESKPACLTRLFRDALLNQCKCLPFNIKVADGVMKNLHSFKLVSYQFTQLGSPLFSCTNDLCKKYRTGSFWMSKTMWRNDCDKLYWQGETSEESLACMA